MSEPRSDNSNVNIYLRGNLGALFARTAAPIILIMTINGLYVVADAFFLGLYVGADALSAVTLIFPLMMMLYAMQTLVSNGMASILARQLGASDRPAAERTFASAHVLATVIVMIAMAIYFLLGPAIIERGAGGAEAVADNARIFMGITMATAPIAFWLSLQIDALRCEGKLGFMALVTVSATLLNIGFNWLFTGGFRWGVAGSAIGSVLAQLICLLVVVAYRWSNRSALRLAWSGRVEHWRQMLALGAPTSLGLLGISLLSAAMIFNLRIWQEGSYVATIAAYGIVNRILTFAYLPLMGVNIAFQTICGNNVGAGMTARANRSLVIALATAIIYCGVVELVIFTLSGSLGAGFVDDPAVIAETRRILPYTVAAYLLFGIPMVLSGYFQALGMASKAGLFGLSRIYLFSIPLSFLLPFAFGETGIWMSTPVAEVLMFVLILTMLAVNARRTGWRFGLIQPA
jgi:putative MATE family efflux protein